MGIKYFLRMRLYINYEILIIKMSGIVITELDPVRQPSPQQILRGFEKDLQEFVNNSGNYTIYKNSKSWNAMSKTKNLASRSSSSLKNLAFSQLFPKIRRTTLTSKIIILPNPHRCRTRSKEVFILSL